MINAKNPKKGQLNFPIFKEDDRYVGLCDRYVGLCTSRSNLLYSILRKKVP